MATFTNRATLSYSGGTANSNTVTGTVNETLAINKAALNDTYDGSSRLVYVISLVNSGTGALSGITLTDDLGAYEAASGTVYPLRYVTGSAAYYVNGVLQTELIPITAEPLVFSGLSLPAGANAILVYEATVTEFAPLATDGNIINTVTASGSLAEDVTASETVTAAIGPRLSITKALSPTTVGEDGSLTYTFIIENSGNEAAVATDDVTVSDLFDPILTLTSVTLDGTPLAETTGYTYNASSGQFDTVPGVITVPAATYTQNPDGSFTVIPGTAVLTVSGTI